jgi:hypothetical protein
MDIPPAQYPLALHIKHSALPSVLARVVVFSFYAFIVCLVIEAKLVSGATLGQVGSGLMGILSMGQSSSFLVLLFSRAGRAKGDVETLNFLDSLVWSSDGDHGRTKEPELDHSLDGS